MRSPRVEGSPTVLTLKDSAWFDPLTTVWLTKLVRISWLLEKLQVAPELTKLVDRAWKLEQVPGLKVYLSLNCRTNCPMSPIVL